LDGDFVAQERLGGDERILTRRRDVPAGDDVAVRRGFFAVVTE